MFDIIWGFRNMLVLSVDEWKAMPELRGQHQHGEARPLVVEAPGHAPLRVPGFVCPTEPDRDMLPMFPCLELRNGGPTSSIPPCLLRPAYQSRRRPCPANSIMSKLK